MTLSDKERVAAKVEELDKLIAELQSRRAELLGAKGAAPAVTAAPKKEATNVTVPPKAEQPVQTVARPVAVKRVKNQLEVVLDSLPWKSFKKKEGEWAFLRTQSGSLIDELKSETEFVDKVRKEGEVVVGKYSYEVSEDKFLNRYYVSAKTV
jgi:hypothetical protein